MTVSSTTSTAQFDPNGITINFPFAFRFFAATDLKVFWQKPDGTIQLLTLNSNYTVQGAGNNAGGSITTIGTPLPNGLLVVSRIMVATQLTSFRNQGEFFAEIHEDAFDKLVMLVQQTIDSQGRGLTVPVADPLGINLVLPSATVRGGKVLGFDLSGQPIVSNLSLEQIEQQPALAMEAASQAEASAEAAGNAESAAGDSASASASAAAAAAASAQSVAFAALQLGMSAWGYRPQPFKGFALDDGQELDRALYPDFAAALDAGLLPTVTQAQWNADPANRACFVAVSSAGKFRMRDRNGVSPGSLGAVFERGDGGGATLIKRDQMQRILGKVDFAGGRIAGLTGPYYDAGAAGSSNWSTGTGSYTQSVGFDSALAARTGTETFPTHATGAWMTRLFGLITPLGSAEAASLATAYASLAARLSALEFAFISSNQTWAIGGVITSSHALGVRPLRTSVEAECITADAGYAVGAVVDLGANQCLVSGANNYGFTTEISATQMVMNIAAQGLAITSKTTKAVVAMTPASWRLRLKAGKS